MTDHERIEELLMRQTEAELPFLVFWVERAGDHDRVQCASNLAGGPGVSEPLTRMLHSMFKELGVAAPGPIERRESDERTERVSGDG